MNKIAFLALVLTFGGTLASASDLPSACWESDSGKDPQHYGSITYSTSPEICTKDNCTQTSATDFDYCKNAKTLIEWHCTPQKRPEMIKIACACTKGSCR